MRRIFKGITTKYMFIFMALIVLTVFFLSVMIATIINNYSVDTEMKELSKSSIIFKNFYNETIFDDKSIEEAFKENHENLFDTLSIIFITSESNKILVADSDGELVLYACYSSAEKEPSISYFSKGNVEASALNSESLPLETKLQVIRYGDLTANDNCNGLFNKIVTWSASALANEYGEIDGYLISFSEHEGQGILFNSLMRSIILTVAWLLIVAIVSLYFISFQLMRPLREISNAAKSFAKGKFDIRVPERGDDELTELAKSFNKMAIELEAKDNMQKQFLSSVSHDLRTPMTTIAGFIDSIIDGAIPKEKQGYYLGIIKNEVQRLNRLVSSLLDLSRLQSGYYKFDKKPFNICELARQTIISLEKQFNDKQLEVEVDTEDFDMLAVGDKDAINQVVYNLCHNAIKFSYDKGKYIVKIRYCDNNNIEFSVWNEGIGIAKEDIAYVFDRFYKSDKSRGLDKTGVGLGLFISKTIIDEHNGDIRVNSEYGKYCEFSFTLPKGEKN